MTLPNQPPVITLLTDFGLADHYVGVMKGVIARICPDARVIDISHEVAPFQIAQGAYLLSRSWRWFPEGTIHVAVVDPGVGGQRKPLAAAADGHFFVVPDNGLLSLAEISHPVAREIQNEALMLKPVSRSFHGRDIFAPAAAHLACGFPFEQVGPLVPQLVRLPSTSAAVLHIDRFGNVITGLKARHYQLAGRWDWKCQIGDAVITNFSPTYGEAPPDSLFLMEGSGGYLEAALREGSAAARMRCRVGDLVVISAFGLLE